MAHLPPTVSLCYGRLYLYRSEEWALHSPSPAGFVCLAFSWPHASFVFSSMQPYLPVTIAVFFYYLEFMCGGVPPHSPVEHAMLWPLLQPSPSPSTLWGRCCHSCLLPPACLFTVQAGSAPPPLSKAQGVPPSLLNVFFLATCLLFRLVFFPLFSLGGGQSVQGGYADLPCAT
jgi:hypothetical protein